jgi:hypothetical protein
MKKIIYLVLLVFVISAFIACKTTPVESVNIENGLKNFEPSTVNGEMSEITLAYARRQNYFNQFGQNDIHPDGIVFYFVVIPLQDNRSKNPTLVELRDFRINGTSYREITRRNGVDDIEPVTIAYSERTIQNDEFHEKINFENGVGVQILKVIIFGTDIPDSGIINIDLKFGFDNEVEEFNYQFKIDSIEK